MNKYLIDHYNKINKINNLYNEFLIKYPNINWLLN